MTSRIILDTKITDVVEKLSTVSGRRNERGEAEFVIESVGWYIYIGNVAIFAGMEKPAFEKNDRVRIIVTNKEKAHGKETAA